MTQLDVDILQAVIHDIARVNPQVRSDPEIVIYTATASVDRLQQIREGRDSRLLDNLLCRNAEHVEVEIAPVRPVVFVDRAEL